MRDVSGKCIAGYRLSGPRAESELANERAPLLDASSIVRIIVPRRQEPAGVIRERSTDDVRRDQFTSPVRAHEPEPRKRAAHERAVARERANEGTILRGLAVVAAIRKSARFGVDIRRHRRSHLCAAA